MFHSFYKTKEWALWAYGGGSLLILVLWLQVQMSVAINTWYGDFYNLLQTAADYKDNPEEGISLLFSKLIGLDYITSNLEAPPSFLVIAMPYVILAIITNWFTRIYGLRWREAITFGFIPRWRNVEEEIEGASQRIQEDCNRFARIVESLGLQTVRAIMTLIAFIPILWGFSDKVDIPIIRDFEGSLVWGSLIVSIGGLLISWVVGIKLPGLEYNNQKVEAAFRKDLVLGEDNKAQYAQPETLFELFTGIRFNYHRLYWHYGYFDLWLNIYDQFMVIVPYLIMGPGLFTGLITLGTMVQISNAFQKVHGGFALFLHNWTTITELRSIYRRLNEFEHNLTLYEKPPSDSAIPVTGE
ncbi:MAG: putative transporter [Halopseudomonas aestusnigri]